MQCYRNCQEDDSKEPVYSYGLSQQTDGFALATGVISGRISYGTGTAVDGVKVSLEANSTDGDALAAALTSLQVSGVTGTMTWTADGNTSKTASAILYYDGVGTLFDSQE